MTLNHDSRFGPGSAPTLAELVRDARVIPIEVEERADYREPLPSIGDIVDALPMALEPESDLVATVPLPLRHRAGGRRRTRAMVGWSAGALALAAGASVAMAAWLTPPTLGEDAEVPTVATPALRAVDTDALFLALSVQALERRTSPEVAVEPPQSVTVPRRTPSSQPDVEPPAPTVAFDSGAARNALDQAAAAAGACRSGDDPSGVARAIVTFAPSGRVTTATVNGPPFAGTATGGCIARALRTATVPPFGGDHITVSKTVVIY